MNLINKDNIRSVLHRLRQIDEALIRIDTLKVKLDSKTNLPIDIRPYLVKLETLGNIEVNLLLTRSFLAKELTRWKDNPTLNPIERFERGSIYRAAVKN